MAQRVLVSDKLAPEGIAVLERGASGGDLEFESRPGLSPDELISAIPEFDALIIRSGTKVTGEVIDAGHRLRAIGRAGIGVDNVDVAEIARGTRTNHQMCFALTGFQLRVTQGVVEQVIEHAPELLLIDHYGNRCFLLQVNGWLV